MSEEKTKTEGAQHLEELIRTIESWTKILHIPKLSKYGILEEDIENITDQTGIKNNPVHLDKGDLKRILKERI